MAKPIPMTDTQRHELFRELEQWHEQNDGDTVPVTNTAPTIDATHLIQEMKDALGGSSNEFH